MARAPTLVLAHAQSNVAEPAETFSLMEWCSSVTLALLLPSGFDDDLWVFVLSLPKRLKVASEEACQDCEITLTLGNWSCSSILYLKKKRNEVIRKKSAYW
jgi:hypothetical protein